MEKQSCRHFQVTALHTLLLKETSRFWLPGIWRGHMYDTGKGGCLWALFPLPPWSIVPRASTLCPDLRGNLKIKLYYANCLFDTSHDAIVAP